MWFQNQKTRMKNKDCETYKKLSENEIIKNELDNYLEKNKDKIRLSFDESLKLFLEYVEENEKIPLSKEVYKEYNIGSWFHAQKKKIMKNKDCDVYKKLAVNEIIKKI